MATGTFYPAADTDTGYWNPPDTLHPSGYTGYIHLGNYAGTISNALLRFQNVTIPQGATITAARITMVSHSDRYGETCNASIACVDADNATPPTTVAAAEALPLTSSTAWGSIPGWAAGAAVETPDIASLVQAVVGRSGWVTGNSLMAVIRDNSSSTSAFRLAWAYSSGSNFPALVVEWTDAPEPVYPTDYDVSSPASLAITTFGPEIFAGQNKVYEWEADQTLPFGPFIWKSKLVLLPAMTNFTAARVEADFSADQTAYFMALAERQAILARNAARISAGGIGGEIAEAPIGTYTLGGDSLEAVPVVGAYAGALFLRLKVYADGVLKQTVDVFSSKPFRLQGGYRSKQYSFQIEGNIAVKKVEIATSIGDLVEA